MNPHADLSSSATDPNGAPDSFRTLEFGVPDAVAVCWTSAGFEIWMRGRLMVTLQPEAPRGGRPHWGIRYTETGKTVTVYVSDPQSLVEVSWLAVKCFLLGPTGCPAADLHKVYASLRHEITCGISAAGY